mmetsp:Transcript_34088/g.73523  ORF Transcript_34088/g.73523 Transcript_34088/m.73523 type:complete len:221 (-) Transcript_34088:1329-1991(-)
MRAASSNRSTKTHSCVGRNTHWNTSRPSPRATAATMRAPHRANSSHCERSWSSLSSGRLGGATSMWVATRNWACRSKKSSHPSSSKFCSAACQTSTGTNSSLDWTARLTRQSPSMHGASCSRSCKPRASPSWTTRPASPPPRSPQTTLKPSASLNTEPPNQTNPQPRPPGEQPPGWVNYHSPILSQPLRFAPCRQAPINVATWIWILQWWWCNQFRVIKQ